MDFVDIYMTIAVSLIGIGGVMIVGAFFYMLWAAGGN